MSNFNVSNLVPVSYDKVAKGTKAIKVGNQIFTFQNSMEFYKCASVAQDVVYYTVANASEYPECNGDYYQFSGTGNENVYKHESSEIYLLRYLDADLAEISSEYEGSPDRTIYYQRHAWSEEGIPTAGWENMDMTDFGVSVTQQKEEAPKMWDGYKAVLTDGVYTFEETVTTGLSYGNGFIPKQDGIYNADATVQVSDLWYGISKDDLVFYASLFSESTVAETGQNLSGSPAGYTTYKGVPCALFQESGNTITAPMSNDFPIGSSPCSLSVWICIDNELTDAGGMGFVGYGEKVPRSAHHVGMSAPNTLYGAVYDYSCNVTDIQTDTWYHYIGIYDGTTLKTYVNGVYVSESDIEFNVLTGNVEIGWSFNISYKLAALRIYSREITQEEIGALANEFTPTE